MAMNNSRNVSVTVESIVSPNSSILLIRPYFIYCHPVMRVYKNGIVAVGAGTRSGFGLATSRVRTTIAPGAGLVVVLCPGGPAKTIVHGRSLIGVVPMVGGRSLLILASRVCDTLACKGRTRADVTSLPKVGRHAVIVGNFSGACSVAN